MTIRRILPAFAFVIAILPAARALELPQIPPSQRVLSLQEVKNYWINRLPVPAEPSRLARDFARLDVEYHRQVGERHRLVEEIRAGRHDLDARLAMLRHNFGAWTLRGDEQRAAEVRAELLELEGVAADEREAAAQADRIERLIAATERLAAAIENNGGELADAAAAQVHEIVPFERDEDIVPRLREEIVIYGGFATGVGVLHPRHPRVLDPCPVVVHPHHPVTGRHPHAKTTAPVAPRGHAPVTPPQTRVRPIAAPRQPQVRQPQVRPAR